MGQPEPYQLSINAEGIKMKIPVTIGRDLAQVILESMVACKLAGIDEIDADSITEFVVRISEQHPEQQIVNWLLKEFTDASKQL